MVMKWLWFGLCLVANIAAADPNKDENSCTCTNRGNMGSPQETICYENTWQPIANICGNLCNTMSCDSRSTTELEDKPTDTTTVTITTYIPLSTVPATVATKVAPIASKSSAKQTHTTIHTHSTPANQYTTKSCTQSTPAPAPANNSSVTTTLAAVTVILFMSLIGVIIGWVVTCFVAIKKGRVTSYKISWGRSHDNPTLQQLSDLRGREPSPLPQVNHYSSQGPDYEVINYSRQAQSAAQPSVRTNIEARNPSNEYDEVEKVEEHMYHVLESPQEYDQRQMTAAAQVENQEREREMNTATLYEVPMSLISSESKCEEI